MRKEDISEDMAIGMVAELVSGEAWFEIMSCGSLVAIILFLSENTCLDIGSDGYGAYIMRILDRVATEQKDPTSRMRDDPGFYLSVKDGKLYWSLKCEWRDIPPGIKIHRLYATREQSHVVYKYSFSKWEEVEE